MDGRARPAFFPDSAHDVDVDEILIPIGDIAGRGGKICVPNDANAACGFFHAENANKNFMNDAVTTFHHFKLMRQK